MGISRRHFLEGLAGAILAPGAAWSSEDGLVVLQDGEKLVVKIGAAAVWTIASDSLSDQVRATVVSERQFRISGKLPCQFAFSAAFSFERVSGLWAARVEWSFPAIKFHARSDPVLLEKLEKQQLRVPVSGKAFRQLTTRSGGSLLQAPGSGTLVIDHALGIGLEAGGNHFALKGKNLSSHRLSLYPLPPGASAAFQTAKISDNAIGAYKTIKIGLRVPDKTAVLFRDDNTVDVRGAVDIAVERSGAKPFLIPCVSGRFSVHKDQSNWSLSPSGLAWSLPTKRVSFGLEPLDGDGGGFKPVEIASRGSKLLRFNTPVSIHSSTLAVTDADRTRFDFGGQPSCIILAAEPKSPSTGLVLTELDKSITLGLGDRPVLRVWRGRDLFHLAFRFKNLNLIIDENPRLAPANPGDHSEQGASVLLAEFPPQHVMERSFLRQRLELPDAGDPLSQADLRKLQRLTVTEGNKEVRSKINDKKRKAESDDIRDDNAPHPFADFSDRWNKEKLDQKYGTWIGPAGLLTLGARRQARRFAKQLREEKLTKLLAKLKSGATLDSLSKDESTDLVEVLGLPRFPLSVAEAKALLTNIPDDKKRGWILAEGRKRDADLAVMTSVPVLMNWPFDDAGWRQLYKNIDPKSLFSKPEEVLPSLKEIQDAFSDTVPEDVVKDKDKKKTAWKDFPESFRRPVEAWGSGRSRLAFETCDAEIPLTIDNLTGWEKFELRVIQRARAPASNPGDVLEAIGLNKKLANVEARLKDIQSSISAPGRFHTALEIPSRLILSPSEHAKWFTPKHAPARFSDAKLRRTVPVWQARMVEPQGPSLRAVWSPDCDVGMFPAQLGQMDEKWRPDSRKDPVFRTAMSPRDRAEIVALTSVYGLPVMAASKDSQDQKDKAAATNTGTNPDELSSQVQTPEGYGLPDLDPGTTALYMPVPLRTRRLALGATGGTLDLDTSFPTVTAARFDRDHNKQAFESFSLERLRLLINDGFDVVTTVVRRGYLFPLGHKASLIKVTEPRLRPIDPARPQLGYSVEQATRIFIEVTRATHLYPCVGQLNAARDLQPRNITLITLRTPDLLDPADDGPPSKDTTTLSTGGHGSIRGWVTRSGTQGGLVGKVFWPRAALGPQGTVRFRMRIDGNPTPVSMPLIFIDHTGAADPETVKALCNYYNVGPAKDGGGPADWGTVQHNGALRTYAAEVKKGQCTFATDWQQIGVTTGNSGYGFDPYLLAAGQPPFYPTLVEAQIRPQQIQELTGSAAPVLRVGYSCDYIKTGFATDPDPSNPEKETYLVVKNSPRPKLDMGNNGDQGGTVARKSIEICGLNRQIGVVGPPALETQCAAPRPADKKADIQGRQLALVEPEGSGLLAYAADTSDGKQLKDFSLNQFTDDATLFGLLKLKTFVEALSAFAPGSVTQVLEETTNLSDKALQQVAELLGPPVLELQNALKDGGISAVFPEFVAKVDTLRENLKTAESAPTLDLATHIWTAGQQVVHELDVIAHAPIAQVAERLLAPLADKVESFRNELRELNWVEKIRDPVTSAIANGVKTFSEAFFTVALPDAQGADVARKIDEVLQNPEIWGDPDPLGKLKQHLSEKGVNPENLAKIEAGALYHLLVPVLQKLQGLQAPDLADAVRGAQGVLDEAAKLRDKLQALIAKAGEICDRGVRSVDELVDSIAGSVSQSATAAAALKTVTSAAADVRKLKGDLEQLFSAVDPKPPSFTAWQEFLAAWIKILESAVDAFGPSGHLFENVAKARQSIKNVFVAGQACADLQPEAVRDALRAIASLGSAQRDLIAAWIGAARIPDPPNAAPLPNFQALADAIRDKAFRTAQSILQGALNEGVLYAVKAGQAQWTKAKGDLQTIGTELAAAGVTDVVALLAQADSALAEAQDTLNEALAPLGKIAGTVADAHRLAAAAVDAARSADQNIRDLQHRLTHEAVEFASALLMSNVSLDIDLDAVATTIFKALRSFYAAFEVLRDDAYRATTNLVGRGEATDRLFKNIFGTPPGAACDSKWIDYIFFAPTDQPDSCQSGRDRLAQEVAFLQQASFDRLQTILQQWRQDASERDIAGPLLIMRNIQHFAQMGAHAAVLRLFDADRLRQELADALKDVVPASRTLSSKLTLPMSTTSIGIGTFRPAGSEPLVLSGETTVKFLDPGVTGARCEGYVPPFELDILSILNINFRHGVRFTKTGLNAQPEVKAPLGAEDIKFGDKLSFLADLSKSLSFGGGGDGPYTLVHVDRPAIEAGYRVGIPVITLGVTFTNIHFAGAIVLPFSNESARVRAALGSIDSQFMISAGIYGGSGFMALEASPRGIEVFEACFEFGGIASIGYGPLQGTAYVTTGAYVRKDGTGCTFAAVFSAGFCAHIACFGVSAAFTLRLAKRDGDSGIEGEAQLTFTFSLGLAKVSYTIHVGRRMEAGFGGGGNSAAEYILPGRVQLAALGGFAPDCYPARQEATLVTESVSPMHEWSAYEAQFDPSFVPDLAA
jgi:ABC-type transporter Mla subunit MlaD